ncbi:MAG TPA: CDP-alcohol phosphatidyltransferase family protein [Acidobacteriota bacterium]|nr:CDP-alcohol phosphatidyltransferase family protein [Acidobacteriota bacterium]
MPVTAFFNVPNGISIARLLIAPFLWASGLLALDGVYLALFLIAGVSDALDGFLARALNQRTEFGARLDIWADVAAYPSAITLARMRPQFFQDYFTPIVGLFATYLILLAFVRWRTGEFLRSHLWSQKASAAALFVFIVHGLLTSPSAPLLWITAGLLLLSFAEIVLLVTLVPSFDSDQPTILTRRS